MSKPGNIPSKRLTIPSNMNLDLRAQVDALLAPHMKTADKPPFTVAELVVMALVMQRKSMTREEVSEWLCERFGYYRKFAAATLIRNPKVARGMLVPESVDDFSRDFHHAFQTLGVPVNSFIMPIGSKDFKVYATEAAAARLFLHDNLGLLSPSTDNAEPAGTSAFFRLPAELRNVIYDMALFVAPCGVQIAANQQNERDFFGKTFRREADGPFSMERWMKTCRVTPSRDINRHNPFLRIPRTSQILAPIMANRQMYAEALPSFYEQHTFYFNSTTELFHALSRLEPSRRALLRSVAVKYNMTNKQRELAPRAFRLLRTLTKLHTLHIHVEEEWLGFGNGTRPPILKFPGLTALKKMKIVGNVHFYSCPTVESELKSVMVVPEPKEKKKSLKRKASDRGEDSEGRTGPAKKVRKSKAAS